eukprot:gnl/Spiro4/4992_TR2492_c0_g1_i1.p1 gnl/Spiro4/4992_TR2492_c0_g1~~gnl/Spiro4/4992_TR2492_c0_g1_i1.p1  ORF type:complete len:448 (+),score=117.23 gnl/Spiro4/4992_TR2492_c0_g1_i1:150-1346(+)
MKYALDQDNLREALKFSSGMICELRFPMFSPKAYYELFMTITAELESLETYFMEVMQKGRRMIELYELVQHAGNILPRLYLLVTVASVYIKSKQAPVKDILRDLVEMCRGVQHPMRGLFLRNYMLLKVRDKLPDGHDNPEQGTVDDSIDFIVQNFTEMTKLWVRMQNQGPGKDRENREKERQELCVLVGYNLVRLSQMEGVDIEKYRKDVLPKLMEQVVAYKDTIAQQYLMDCIIQVFPDEYHILALEPFLQTCTQLQPGVDVKVILTGLMNRLSTFALQNPGVPLSLQTLPSALIADYEALRDRLFDMFGEHVNRISGLSLCDTLQLQNALLNLALKCYSERLAYVDSIFVTCSRVISESPNAASDPSTSAQILELLTLPIQYYKNILVILGLERYN